MVRGRAAAHPRRTAFVFLADGEREAARLGYGALDAAVAALAARLRARLAPGQPVLLVQPPGLDYVVAFLACLDAGAVAVPVHPPLRREDRRGRLARVAADAGARLALTTPELAPRLELPGVEAWVPPSEPPGGEPVAAPGSRPAPPPPDAPAFLQYTSGTTGDPRGVVVLHRHLAANEMAIQQAFGQSEESVVVGWLPLHHDMGLIGTVLQPLWCGGQAVLMAPAAFLQRPRRWLEAVTRYRATTTGGPNFAYDLCVRRIPPAERAGLDLSTLEVAFNGSEPVRPETLERFAAAFAPHGFRREAFLPCYGLAEATLFVAGSARGEAPAVAEIGGVPGVGCGRAWEGERLLVVDPERRVPRAPGEEGELWIAGPSVAAGYHGRPEESAEIFAARLAPRAGGEQGSRNGGFAQGGPAQGGPGQGGPGQGGPRDGRPRNGRPGDGGPWLRTGDLAVLGADGELFVTGRAGDLVILRGRNLHPQDLEATAEAAHPALRPAGCAAFSVEVETEEGPAEAGPADTGPAEAGPAEKGPAEEASAGKRLREERLVVVCEVERRREEEALAAVAAVRRAVVAAHQAAPHAVLALRAGTLPRTTSGKVRRGACRELWRQGGLTVLAQSGAPQRSAPASPSSSAADSTHGPGHGSAPGGSSAPVAGRARGTGSAAAVAPARDTDDGARAGALTTPSAVAVHAAAAAGVAVGELVASAPLPLDSLQAIELRQALAADLGVEVLLETLLAGPTLGELERQVAEAVEAGAAVPVSAFAADSGAGPGLAPDSAVADGQAVPATGEHPLTAGQRALWLLERLAPGRAGLHLAFAARVRSGGVAPRPAALAAAFDRLVRRHPVLAGSLRVVDGEPRQRLPSDGRVDFALLPLAPGDELPDRLAAEVERPFDLEAGPLLRVRVAQCGSESETESETGTVLLVVVHHLAADFASLETLVSELARELAGEEVPPPPASYAEHVHRQRELLSGPRGAALAAWWRDELAGAPHDLALPADRSALPAGASGSGAPARGAAHHFRLPAGTTAALHRAAAAAGTTPFAVLLAAWTGLLVRYTGQRDLLVGTPVAGRPAPRFRDVVGYFANLLPLRGDAAGDPGLGALAARCGRRLRRALEHQDLPFPALVEAVAPERAPSRHPLVQAALVVEAPRRLPVAGAAALVAGTGRGKGAGAAEPLRAGSLELAALPLPREPSQLDLLLTLVPDGSGPAGAGRDRSRDGGTRDGGTRDGGVGTAAVLDYDPRRFDATTAERLARHFVRLLAAGLAAPDVPLSRLSMLDGAERRQALAFASRPPEPAAPTIPAAFADQAAWQPDAVAVAWDGGSLSFAELDRRSAALARRLVALGATTDLVVGVVLPPRPERVVAVLAVLRAGAAFVGVEPDDPAARRTQVLAAAGARLVVATDPDLEGAGPWRLVAPWASGERPGARPGEGAAEDERSPGTMEARTNGARRSGSRLANPPREAAAYVMFTSGSTGAPKGVVVPHRALANLAAEARAIPGLAPGRRLLHKASLAFDLSAAEMLLPLATGATLCLAPAGTRRSGRLLASAVHRLQADTLISTPTMLGLVEAGEELAPVRTIFSGGERCPKPLARRFAAAPGAERGRRSGNIPVQNAPVRDATGQDPVREALVHDAPQHDLAEHPARLYNAYGPTETTVWSTRSACPPRHLEGMALLGQPVRSTRMLLLGSHGELVPPGAVGELVLGGEGLARGYLGRPAATAEAFVPDPWAGGAGLPAAEAGPGLGEAGPGARLYRTGDLARRRAGGEVELVGRRDAQLKVRGHRVEPAEVEAAVAALPGVAAAAAGAHHGRLVAWVVPAPGAALLPEVLRAALAERLPAHLVPTLFVPLDRLPITANGKLDRRALPAPPAAVPAGTAPRSELERIVAGLWRDELGIAEVGVESGFFELGGTSLGLARIHARLCAVLEREIPIADLFGHVTVAALAAHLAAAPAVAARAGQQSGQQATQQAGTRRAAMAHQLRRRRAGPPSDGDAHHD